MKLLIVGGALALAIGAVLAAQLPDIRRYMKIRSM